VEEQTMKPIGEMSDVELRIALAMAFPNPFVNIRTGRDGKLVGDSAFLLSERPTGIPNWPSKIEDARFLEDAMATYGLHDEYLRNLALTAKSTSPIARQISEAALMAFRSHACAEI
jgi:hypothetical protein